MRKIIVTTFSTLDGVLQSPGGPDEDRTGGFDWGGWQFGYSDAVSNEATGRIMAQPFDLLLGRRTYEIFAAYWPYKADAIGGKFNRVTKYVVATTPVDTSWVNTVLIGNDVVGELRKLKAADGPDLLVHGSGRLVQTLLAHHLVDVLHLWIYPLTLGRGKKLFEEGTQAQGWKLTNTTISTTGAILASYVPDGEVKRGSYVPDEVSDAEIARRAKWRAEDNAGSAK